MHQLFLRFRETNNLIRTALEVQRDGPMDDDNIQVHVCCKDQVVFTICQPSTHLSDSNQGMDSSSHKSLLCLKLRMNGRHGPVRRWSMRAHFWQLPI